MSLFLLLKVQMADPAVYEQEEELNSESVQKVLQFLQKNGFREAEQVLSREAAAVLSAPKEPKSVDPATSSEQLTNLILSQHAVQGSKTDPNLYFSEYEHMCKFVDGAFDKFKPELSCLLYPTFAHMYLELLAAGQTQAAFDFYNRFSVRQESQWQRDVEAMKRVNNDRHLADCELIQTLAKNQFIIRMSKSCLGALKPFILKHLLLQQIMKNHMSVEALDAAPRSKEAVEAMTGGLLGEAVRNVNKTRMYHGVPKDDFSFDGFGEESLAKKKRQSKGKDGKDKKKMDPSAPTAGRVPLPEWNESVKAEKRKIMKDAQKRLKISSDNLPCICFYTVLNAHEGVSSCHMSDDCSMLATGYGNSTVQIRSLTNEKLKPLKPYSQLELLDQEADDIEAQLLDDAKATDCVTLTSHSGPVYGLSLSPDKRLLLSCSEDSTVRLWSTQLWSNLVVYRIGGFPIWDVSFCSRGYYFATGSADRAAMLWATDKMQPIRLFAEHFSDVNCVEFHPNCNYLATGSEDRTVRVWDLQNGGCVRYFTGHKAGIQALKCSHDGRLLATGDADGCVQLWDVAQSKMLASNKRTDGSAIYSLAFSRDNNVLAYGGLDNSVSLLSVEAAMNVNDQTETAAEPKVNEPNVELARFRTKDSPVVSLNFTSRNLLLAVGAYGQ